MWLFGLMFQELWRQYFAGFGGDDGCDRRPDVARVETSAVLGPSWLCDTDASRVETSVFCWPGWAP